MTPGNCEKRPSRYLERIRRRSMATLTVSVPQDVKEYIEEGGEEEFADAGAFLAELVRRDQERRLEELRRIVDEGTQGPLSTRTTKEIFEAAVERVRQRGKLRE
jgi:Arc/MetJ-type ribon-helix-helix transcriptional regulator